MFLAFILLIIVAFCGAQFAPPGRLHTDYCSKATTTAVNGIFVVMVFFRHLNTYLQVSAADPLQKQWVTRQRLFRPVDRGVVLVLFRLWYLLFH